MGANSQLKTGSVLRDGKRGSLFYKLSSGTSVDGGVSETFADTFTWNNVEEVTVNDSIAKLAYIFKNSIATQPTFGGGDLSGLVFQFDVTNINPNSVYYKDYKGLLAYQLRDHPRQRGAVGVSNDLGAVAWAPTDGICTDLLVYSTSSENKMIDPVYDFGFNFSNLSEKIYDNYVITDYDTLIHLRNPYMILHEVENDSEINQGYKLARYATFDYRQNAADIVEIIELKLVEPSGTLSYLADRMDAYYTPINNRSLFTDPRWLLKDFRDDKRIHHHHVESINLPQMGERKVSRFIPPQNSLLRDVEEATTYTLGALKSENVAAGNVTHDTKGDAKTHIPSSDRSAAYAKIDSAPAFAMKSGSGVHFDSLWAYEDDRIPKYGDSKQHRAICRLTSKQLPVPIQLDSNLIDSSADTTHVDAHSIGGRIDIIFKVNEMPVMPYYSHSNLSYNSQSAVNQDQYALERCFAIMLGEEPPVYVNTDNRFLVEYLKDGMSWEPMNDVGGVTACSSQSASFMGAFIFNYGGVLRAMGTSAALKPDTIEDASSVDGGWIPTFAIDTHVNWYEDWYQNTSNTQYVLRTLVPGFPAKDNGGVTAGLTTNTHPRFGVTLAFGTWIKLSIIMNPDSKYSTWIYTDASTGKYYGQHEVANGLDASGYTAVTGDQDNAASYTTQATGVDALCTKSNYLSFFVNNTHIDVLPFTDSTVTDYTELPSYASGGYKAGDKIDSRVSVYVDSVNFAGFMSDAVNCSTRAENAFSAGNVSIKSHDVLAYAMPYSTTLPNEGVLLGPDAAAPYQANPERTARLNRNTILIGHPTFKGVLGNNDSTFAGDEEAWICFDNFSANNFGNTSMDVTITNYISLLDFQAQAKNFQGFATGFTDASTYCGKQMNSDFALVANNEITAAEQYFAGNFLNEGFKFPGAVAFDWTDASASFTAREHILASSKVIAVNSHREIVVARPGLLKINDGTSTSPDFILYRYNDRYSGKENTNWFTVKIEHINYETGVIQLNKDISGSLRTYDMSNHTKNAGHWFISPKAYWVYMHFFNIDSSDNLLDNKSYGTVHSIISDDSEGAHNSPYNTAGFTWNEFLRSDTATSDNAWDLNFLTEDSSVVLDVDFGFGSIADEDSTHKNHTKNGFINRVSTDTAETKYLDLSPLITVGNNNLGNDIAIGMIHSVTQTSTNTYEVNVATASNTTKAGSASAVLSKVPQLLTQFFDTLPEAPSLAVKPNEISNFLVDFEWEVSDDDLWYGLLLVDTQYIDNQYTGAFLHFPLNESFGGAGSGHGGAVYGTTTVAENIVGTKADALGGSSGDSPVTLDAEGLAGFSYRFTGETGGQTSRIQRWLSIDGAAGDVNKLTDKMSIIMHIVPENTDIRYLIDIDDKVEMWLDVNNKVQVRIYARTDEYVELSSNTIPADGELPTCVIVTFDKYLKSGNCKLFINGVLVDQSGTAITIANALDRNNWLLNQDLGGRLNRLMIGAPGGTSTSAAYSGFEGKIEEVVIYDNVIYPIVPQDNKFTLDKPLKEMIEENNSASQSYNARLFIKDFHNIRGSSTTEVASSPNISFRKAAFRLDNS